MNQKSTFYGYDGNGYNVGDRVELHPACDYWMRGARYGVVVAIRPMARAKITVVLDKVPTRRLNFAADLLKRIDSPTW